MNPPILSAIQHNWKQFVYTLWSTGGVMHSVYYRLLLEKNVWERTHQDQPRSYWNQLIKGEINSWPLPPLIEIIGFEVRRSTCRLQYRQRLKATDVQTLCRVECLEILNQNLLQSVKFETVKASHWLLSERERVWEVRGEMLKATKLHCPAATDRRTVFTQCSSSNTFVFHRRADGFPRCNEIASSYKL